MRHDNSNLLKISRDFNGIKIMVLRKHLQRRRLPYVRESVYNLYEDVFEVLVKSIEKSTMSPYGG